MRFVERAEIRPHTCAVIPWLERDHPRGFFDTGNYFNTIEGRVYVSVEAVEQMARKLNWAPPEDVAELKRVVEFLEKDKEHLEQEVRELNRDFEAIDILASKGFQARKKPGRRPQHQEAA